jgi:hypothetical protein
MHLATARRIATAFALAVATAPLAAQVVNATITSAPGTAQVEPGVTVNAWLYNGQLPGAPLRITQGQTLRVRYRNHAPLMELTKAGIVARGLALGVDYGLTHSCYDPVDGLACGRCDSCALRRKGFVEAGVAERRDDDTVETRDVHAGDQALDRLRPTGEQGRVDQQRRALEHGRALDRHAGRRTDAGTRHHQRRGVGIGIRVDQKEPHAWSEVNEGRSRAVPRRGRPQRCRRGRSRGRT